MMKAKQRAQGLAHKGFSAGVVDEDDDSNG